MTSSNDNNSNDSLKFAVAMALVRSKFLTRHANIPSSSVAAPDAPPCEDKALRWKRKAKERKLAILRLKENLKEAEDRLQHDLFPQSASCKCYFFDDMGAGFDHRYDDVLRRRFIRQVRFKERKISADCLTQGCHYSESNVEVETEQLRASVDFLIVLCDSVSCGLERNFSNWSHQAVEFILVSVKSMLQMGKNEETVDLIINSLVMRLVRRMCHPLPGSDLQQTDAEPQFCVQHIIRKLGSEPYIGLRALLSVSQRILAVAESLLSLDPFDDAFVSMHTSMFTMIQLIEFVALDHLRAWSMNAAFDTLLLEEWMWSVIHARKALELLESRHGLYALYMDRAVGAVAKQLGQVPWFQNLNPEVLDGLLH